MWFPELQGIPARFYCSPGYGLLECHGMLAEYSTGPVRNLLGLSGPSLELAGACLLAVGIVGYAIRLIYYSLSAGHPVKDRLRSSSDHESPDSTYKGPYCAG